MAAPPPAAGKWPTGLCGCFSDCGTCCCCYWCHMCQYGSVASDIDPSSSCCGQCCCYWLLSMCCLQGLIAGPKRATLRASHYLPPEPCGDCCVHTCCGPCAVAQEARIVKKYGAQPSQPAFVTAPMTAPPPQTMMAPPPHV